MKFQFEVKLITILSILFFTTKSYSLTKTHYIFLAKAKIKGNSVSVMADHKSNSLIIAEVSKDQIIEIYSRFYDNSENNSIDKYWFMIKISNDQFGWIHGSSIEKFFDYKRKTIMIHAKLFQKDTIGFNFAKPPVVLNISMSIPSIWELTSDGVIEDFNGHKKIEFTPGVFIRYKNELLHEDNLDETVMKLVSESSHNFNNGFCINRIFYVSYGIPETPGWFQSEYTILGKKLGLRLTFFNLQSNEETNSLNINIVKSIIF